MKCKMFGFKVQNCEMKNCEYYETCKEIIDEHNIVSNSLIEKYNKLIKG